MCNLHDGFSSSVQLRLVTPDVSIAPEILADLYNLFKVPPSMILLLMIINDTRKNNHLKASITLLHILCLQTEHFITLYWGDSSSAAAAEAAAWRYSDCSRSFMERQYRLDRPQFKSLYGLLVPWPGNSSQHTDTVANRTFTLLDQDCDNLVTFRDFAGWLGGRITNFQAAK